ncbi:MAG: large subunit ribosomal protein L9 [Saprospiraceae bacterium]|jgi:large subunit ribosomal protein L9
MEIILLKDIDKVGDKHEVVTVKNGYGRNFLIPSRLAIIANKTNRLRLDELKKEEGAQEAQLVGVYQEMADKLKGKTIKIGAKAGTSGKIFGSVTNVQIAQALKDQFDIEVARKKIDLPEEIKNIGAYKVILNLHKDVVAEVDFEVVQE